MSNFKKNKIKAVLINAALMIGIKVYQLELKVSSDLSSFVWKKWFDE